MQVRRAIVIVLRVAAGLVVLTGCSGNSSPTLTTPSTVTVTATVRATPEPTPTKAPTPADDRSYHEVTDEYGGPSFASPSGRIWCEIHVSGATCMTDFIDQKSLPQVRDCGESGYTGPPNVVVLDEGRVEMMCYNDSAADPRRGSQYDTQWVESYGQWAKVTVKGEEMELATLPYGKAMRGGAVVCTSEDFGITCVNRETGHGFLIRNRGVVRF